MRLERGAPEGGTPALSVIRGWSPGFSRIYYHVALKESFS
jgi:hypothetical protein